MSTQFRLRVPRTILDGMIAQAIAELPNECCGLLAGRLEAEGRVAHVIERYPLVNAAASPTRYEAETRTRIAGPRSLFAAHRAIHQGGLKEVALYHSHPTSEPVPSRTDLEQAFWPDCICFIVSLKASSPEVRGWWLNEEGYTEADWAVVES